MNNANARNTRYSIAVIVAGLLCGIGAIVFAVSLIAYAATKTVQP